MATVALLALAPAAIWLWLIARLAQMLRRVGTLADVPLTAADGSAWPRLSVIVPARDEARDVEAALRTLLAQDYPGLEIVAVDDRSADGTGAILDALAESHPAVRAVHVRELPAGWLGKTHACARGAEAATGEWLLFTDADVRFAPDALRRSVAFAQGRGLGHVVAWPRLVAPGFWARSFQATFAVFLSLKTRPWELHRPATRGYVGVGAFNLVSRAAYRRIGGHARLALEVVDDVKLGLVLRRSGVPQGAVDSGGLVSVPWARDLSSSLRGLMKNAFAGVEWRWGMVATGTLAGLWLTVGPWLAAAMAHGDVTRGVAVACGALPMALLSAVAVRSLDGNGLEGLSLPLTGAMLAGALLVSAVLATWRGAISWRGTPYPLPLLRAGCVREADWPARDSVGWPPRPGGAAC